jgi:dTDP-4-dehydrorhamnose 3,5-epimerase
VRLEETGIPGCFTIKAPVFADARGSFVKTFQNPQHEAAGLRTDWREEYFTTSHEGVLRGMHFQVPPADHAKMVNCVRGEVLDVVIDLRHGSPTYGEYRSFTLSETCGTGVYIPSGCAHGFLSLGSTSTMYYKVTSVHSPAHDAGIAWNGFGFDWPSESPILSERDQRHPPLSGFNSPFRFIAGDNIR